MKMMIKWVKKIIYNLIFIANKTKIFKVITKILKIKEINKIINKVKILVKLFIKHQTLFSVNLWTMDFYHRDFKKFLAIWDKIWTNYNNNYKTWINK